MSTRNNRRLKVDEMEEMGHFLIVFCDGIERHGLVDYELGVWEEEILDRKMISISCTLLTLMKKWKSLLDALTSIRRAGGSNQEFEQ